MNGRRNAVTRGDGERVQGRGGVMGVRGHMGEKRWLSGGAGTYGARARCACLNERG